MKILITTFALCLLAYAVLVIALYTQQRRILYMPSTNTPDITPWIASGARAVDIPSTDSLTLRAWHWAANNDAPTILYFQGNAGDISDRAFKADIFAKNGYGVVLAGYRGFSGNGGAITENGLYEDARAHIAWLNARGVETDNIILYGESLGSGVATHTARTHNIKAVILEAPFTSVQDIAAKRYFYVPVRALLKDKFLSIDNIAHINAPLLVIHGTNDTTVP